MPGSLTLPAPDALRSPFRHPDGSHDWRTELDHGFHIIDQQSAGSLAAAVVEPIVSSGGILDLPPGFPPQLPGVRRPEQRARSATRST